MTVSLRISAIVKNSLLFVVQTCNGFFTVITRGIEQRLPPDKRRRNLSRLPDKRVVEEEC